MSLAKSLREILPAVRMTTDEDFALWTTSILLPKFIPISRISPQTTHSQVTKVYFWGGMAASVLACQRKR